MLEFRSGMMGLPLRLLAREVYDRVRAQVGPEAVALVTGEERRVPAHPRFWICTVEAMPALAVEFLAVDEIQLAAHHERGHIFTERLLQWRGTLETWFLGAETIRPMLQALLPTARVEKKPRLSVLRGTGNATLGQLPPRTAVVAFSAARVYELAERLKLKRGGAAVVLGALSPRTRNAQVQMYQAGEVDFLVATDAIGMGLNMNVDCVAFADLKKYDGRQSRGLDDAEMAQIAGRAGRNRNDGQFCTLAPLPPLPFAVQNAIEEHRFAPVLRLFWRNAELDHSSMDALVQSLSARPFAPGLILTDNAEDQQALARLVRRGDVQALAVGPERVRLLWQVCQIPDFRKLLLDDHFELLAAVFLQLAQKGQLSTDWVRTQVQRLDDVAGELDTLLVRMAAIRTWTFICHRSDWLADAAGWQERTLAIEDRLSDALHEQLLSRFVDRHGKRARKSTRTAPAAKARPQSVPARVRPDQTAHALADLAAFVTPVSASEEEQAAARAWTAADESQFRLGQDGCIYDGAQALGRLTAGTELLRPELLVLPAFPASLQQAVRARLATFVRHTIDEHFAPLQTAWENAGSRGLRAILYGLQKGLGTVSLDELDEFVFEDLAADDQQVLRRMRFSVWRRFGYLRPLTQTAPLRLRWALASVHWPERRRADAPDVLSEGICAAPALRRAAGYLPLGHNWVRIDRAVAAPKHSTPSTRRR